jgi:hypothetical protein
MLGLPYNVFTKLFDTMVWPVINYGAAIWGTRTFSCIDSIVNRAMRFYLGTGKYTPNAAVIGDMGWDPALVRQLSTACAFWSRMFNMDVARTNKKVFKFCAGKAAHTCKNWIYRIIEMLKSYNLDNFTAIENYICKKNLVNSIKIAALDRFKGQWSETINTAHSRSGNGGNKLRTYKLFKQEFKAESYVKMILPAKHRSALSKFRSGVAPLRIETGRFEGLPVEQRFCPFCRTHVEDEFHVIMQCDKYNDIRDTF